MHNLRHGFQAAMEDEFRGTVEELTRAKVTACLLQVHTNPDVAVELFVFERDAGGESPSIPPISKPRRSRL